MTAATKTCMEKYSATDGTTFGYSAVNSQAVKDGILNGQYCQGGMAYNSGSNTAVCFTVAKVETDLSSTAATPYKCTATDTTNLCKYVPSL